MRRSLAFVLVLLAVGVPSAHADGDPASDTLVIDNVFLPAAAHDRKASSALAGEVARVYAQGERVRVAVIGAREDLGAVPSLFGRPEQYAQFLGQELRYYYLGPLLIVMPSGFGIYDGGRSTAAEQAVLARSQLTAATADDLVRSAAAAVAAMRSAGALRSKDILAPFVEPLDATGRRGAVLKLTYLVLDDSGRSSIAAQLVAGPRLLARWSLPLRPVRGDRYLALQWRVPRTLAYRTLKFCITGTDPSGNRSARHCAPVAIR